MSATATLSPKVRWGLEGNIYKVRLSHRRQEEGALSKGTDGWQGLSDGTRARSTFPRKLLELSKRKGRFDQKQNFSVKWLKN